MNRAVITADIIASTRMERARLSRLMRAVEEFLIKLRERGQILRFEFFQGDSFQLVVSERAAALELSTLIKSHINEMGGTGRAARGSAIQTDVRQAIGIGEVTLDGPLAHQNDPAFVYSGRGLKELKAQNRLLGIFTGDTEMEREMDTTLYLWEHILRGWNISHAQTVQRKLRKLTERQIAAEFDISQSAVNQSARKAGWRAFRKMNRRYVELQKTYYG